jgi:hypothetical protein
MLVAFHVPTMLNSQTVWPNAVAVKQIRINEVIMANRFMVPSFENPWERRASLPARSGQSVLAEIPQAGMPALPRMISAVKPSGGSRKV